MPLCLQKSAIDPTLYEIVEGEEVIREIPILFRLYKWPRSFESIEMIERWIQSEERRLAKGAAYRLLTARSQSSIGVRKKLAQRGFSAGVSEELIEELMRLGYLSDGDFTSSLIEREIRRGHGPHYIEMKLRSQGLDAGQVRKIVSEDVQREAIRKLLPKLRNPAAALQRRGFDTEFIFSELKNFLNRR